MADAAKTREWKAGIGSIGRSVQGGYAHAKILRGQTSVARCAGAGLGQFPDRGGHGQAGAGARRGL